MAIESVPVRTSFAEVADVMRPLAEKKSHSLVVNTPKELSVRADAVRFKQVLMNLIGNAIKFTPEGGKIELAAPQLGEVVRVEVRDSGSGIPPKSNSVSSRHFIGRTKPRRQWKAQASAWRSQSV
ncbi:MAG: HAMP domain-containing sensor histidine kinase [Candidatus Acidiferrales bacterium]